jgi:hypothetical protein
MTEAEWLTSNDPVAMVEYVRERVPDRLLYLYASAVCGGISWVERQYDGYDVTPDLIAREGDRYLQMNRFANSISDGLFSEARYLACTANIRENIVNIVRLVLRSDALISTTDTSIHRLSLAYPAHARCVFGNPFRFVSFDQSWLTPTFRCVLKSMNYHRVWHMMPVLADEMKDAGCDNQDILRHCRETFFHVRGCWIVESLK